MKSVLCLLYLVGLVYCSDVLDLGDSNFKTLTKDEDMVLVEFFAPWCGHCKRLAPEYETAATALKEADSPAKLAKVDCTEAGKETCSKYGVSGYPTLKIFRGGEVSADYDGPRDSAGIVSYMKKNSGPSSKILTDVDNLELKLSSAKDVLVVGYFSGETDLYKRFLKAADQKRADFNFAHSTNADINTHAGHVDAIVVYRPSHLHAKFEAAKEVLSDASKATALDIVKFVEEKHIGLVGQIKPNNEASFTKPMIVAYYKVDFERDLKGSRYWRNRIARVAKKFVGEFTFAFAAKSDYSAKMSDWGFNADNNEVYAVAHDAKSLVYKMEGKFSVESFNIFVNEFKDDKLKPYIKSEEVPADNDGPVKVVVGRNFDEIVNDPTKDVLIEFYAPWCGHCKTLEPKFNELGEKLKDVKDVVIAKMDATANDVPPAYEVSGFPTLYWAPMGSKDAPKKYQGGREVTDFVEYIKKEATNPVELTKKKKKKKEL